MRFCDIIFNVRAQTRGSEPETGTVNQENTHPAMPIFTVGKKNKKKTSPGEFFYGNEGVYMLWN
jgi:hypothetical protein